ncbi:TetR/AcrR family transcriptional regulator [Streptomyces sp. NPDC054933]
MKDKPAERVGYHHRSLPAALTAAALALLDERGLERVTVREVARRAGVSPGAPFRHFADRQALLTAVAGHILSDFEQWQLAAVANAEGPAMRAFGLGFVRYAIRHPHRFELIRSRVFGPRQPNCTSASPVSSRPSPTSSSRASRKASCAPVTPRWWASPVRHWSTDCPR